MITIGEPLPPGTLPGLVSYPVVISSAGLSRKFPAVNPVGSYGSITFTGGVIGLSAATGGIGIASLGGIRGRFRGSTPRVAGGGLTAKASADMHPSAALVIRPALRLAPQPVFSIPESGAPKKPSGSRGRVAAPPK